MAQTAPMHRFFDSLAEEHLRHVAAQVFDTGGAAMLITDRDNRILAVNAAFTRLTGYEEDEVLGRNPKILSAGMTEPEAFADLWYCLEAADKWCGDLWDKTKDGKVYPKRLCISVLRDASGVPEFYIGSFTDIGEQREAAERLAYLAHHDALTGLHNRVALEAQFQQAISRAQRQQQQVAVMLIDLDRFKNINDTLGHHVGDSLLKCVAERLRDAVRASDIVARLGGDEFVVILPDLENAMAATGVASKIKHALDSNYPVEGHNLYTTPSIGIALFPADGESEEVLMRNADTAMYHAKAQGRNNFQFFAAAMNLAANERVKLEDGLRAALEATHRGGREFQLHFQPQLHLASGRIVGLEALARWQHPEFGAIPPTKFIPVAEETGLIQPLGDWVFWEACRNLRGFKDAGIHGVRLAINLSAQQLRHEALPSVVRGALACYELTADEIELEITESVAMQNPQATIAILEQLSDMGIVLAIDDFGTGYSSLSYLKQLPINRLKLDRSFVKDIDVSRDDAAICSATIVLGHNLGLDLVAEGVETESQRDYLGRLGCDVLQGFLYSRPVPADEAIDFIKGWPGGYGR